MAGESILRIGVSGGARAGVKPRPLLTPGQERTLAALEQALPVAFVTDARDVGALDALLVLSEKEADDVGDATPLLTQPRLVLAHERSSLDPSPGAADPVRFSAEHALLRPLRHRSIAERDDGMQLPASSGRGTVLASRGGSPIWRCQLDRSIGRIDWSAYPLASLDEGETLREHLRPGRLMGLLPLVHFLLGLLREQGWQTPAPRAAFVVDDPNLHWRSYGFLNYERLVEQAASHGYHVVFATVPLDGWLVDRRACSLLARNRPLLSLAMHGNDHVARELARVDGESDALATIAQGLRRIAALERRTGVPVDRVLVPPHEACSEAALGAAFRLGMEAACVSRPHPWRDGLPAATPIAGWQPADLVAGGLPVLPRFPLSAGREDLPLRALLGQPLILYGHHRDFATGLDALASAAADIASLGDVRWGPLSWIARQGHSSRREGERLHVGLHARRASLPVGAGVRELYVKVDRPVGDAAMAFLQYEGQHFPVELVNGVGTATVPLARTTAGADAHVKLELAPRYPLQPEQAPGRPARPWPLLRRGLVEARDRGLALAVAARKFRTIPGVKTR